MERKLQKLEHCQTEVVVTFSKEEWEKAQTKAFNKLKENVNVPGFRKGHAPDNLVKDKIDQGRLYNDAIDSLLPTAYQAIIEEDKVVPFTRPEITIDKLTKDELVVKFIITGAPEIKLGTYKNLQVGKTEPSVSDEEVESEIKKLLKENATLKTKEGKVEEGDTVVMDFEGSVNGEKFEGGTASNYELEVGSHYFIPGFEEQLIGHTSGEQFDVNVTFPEQYMDNLKGKPAVFKINLHEIKCKILPELNDEFVKELNIKAVETVEQLKNYKKQELLNNKKRSVRVEYLNKLFEEIEKNSQIDIPQAVIDAEVEARRKDAETRMQQSGFQLKQYLEVVGQNEEQFMETLKNDAIKNLKAVTILREVAKLEDIVVGEKELEFEYAKMAQQYNMKIEDVKKALENQQSQLQNQILLGQAEDYLFNNNN